METQTRLSRHNKFISAENITIFSVSSDDYLHASLLSQSSKHIYIYIKSIDFNSNSMPTHSLYIPIYILCMAASKEAGSAAHCPIEYELFLNRWDSDRYYYSRSEWTCG